MMFWTHLILRDSINVGVWSELRVLENVEPGFRKVTRSHIALPFKGATADRKKPKNQTLPLVYIHCTLYNNLLRV